MLNAGAKCWYAMNLCTKGNVLNFEISCTDHVRFSQASLQPEKMLQRYGVWPEPAKIKHVDINLPKSPSSDVSNNDRHQNDKVFDFPYLNTILRDSKRISEKADTSSFLSWLLRVLNYDYKAHLRSITHDKQRIKSMCTEAMVNNSQTSHHEGTLESERAQDRNDIVGRRHAYE